MRFALAVACAPGVFRRTNIIAGTHRSEERTLMSIARSLERPSNIIIRYMGSLLARHVEFNAIDATFFPRPANVPCRVVSPFREDQARAKSKINAQLVSIRFNSLCFFRRSRVEPVQKWDDRYLALQPARARIFAHAECIYARVLRKRNRSFQRDATFASVNLIPIVSLSLS